LSRYTIGMKVGDVRMSRKSGCKFKVDLKMWGSCCWSFMAGYLAVLTNYSIKSFGASIGDSEDRMIQQYMWNDSALRYSRSVLQ
jgi:hypothetical protein